MQYIILAKLRHYVPRKILLTLYNSLILPYISFGLSAWGQAAKHHLDKLLKLQKRAIRFIYFIDFQSIVQLHSFAIHISEKIQ